MNSSSADKTSRTRKIACFAWSEPWCEWIEEGFKALGHTTLIFLATRNSARVVQQLESFKPDLIVIRNTEFTHPQNLKAELENIERDPNQSILHFIKSSKIPSFFWFHDTPLGWGHAYSQENENIFRHLLDSSHIQIGVADTSHIEFFENSSLKTIYLPISVPDAIFKKFPINFDLPEKFSHFISYSGSILWGVHSSLHSTHDEVINHYARNLTQEIKSELKPHASDQEIFNILTEFFNSWITSESNFETLKDAFLIRLASVSDKSSAQFGSCFNKCLEAHHHFQIYETIRLMVSQMQMKVFGNPLWSEWFKDYTSISVRLSQDELYQLYQESFLSFAVTKWHFQRAIHERAFLIYAAGGLPLIDYRSDQEKFFGPGELLTYKDIKDIKNILEDLRSAPTKRNSLISAAREKIAAAHCYSHRAQTIINSSLSC